MIGITNFLAKKKPLKTLFQRLLLFNILFAARSCTFTAYVFNFKRFFKAEETKDVVGKA